MGNHIKPVFCETFFNCPHCGVCATMDWTCYLYGTHGCAPFAETRYTLITTKNASQQPEDICFAGAKCKHCKKLSIWVYGTMQFPVGGNAPPPHGDMPESVLGIYREAACVFQYSPRAGAVLLRLALEHLMQELGAEGKTINDQIGDLVIKGLSPVIQQSLDSLRILGNEGVHIGSINVNADTCLCLFNFINLIVKEMIGDPGQVQAVYATLPKEKRDGVENRDRGNG